MRLIYQNVTGEALGGTLYHGARDEGWRLWEGILRVRNDGTGSATVTLRSAETGEQAVTPITVTGVGGSSSAVFNIPGAYVVDIGTVTAPINISVALDGDTSGAEGRRPDEASGFDSGFDSGF